MQIQGNPQVSPGNAASQPHARIVQTPAGRLFHPDLIRGKVGKEANILGHITLQIHIGPAYHEIVQIFVFVPIYLSVFNPLI